MTTKSRTKSSGRTSGKAGSRELLEPNAGDKRFARRDEGGQFAEQDDVGRSLNQDRRRDAQSRAKPGHGDDGDRDTGEGRED